MQQKYVLSQQEQNIFAELDLKLYFSTDQI